MGGMTMTEQEKQFLLQDLCARLPYRVLCKSGNEVYPLKDIYIDGAVGNKGQLRLCNCKYGGIYKSIDEIKPYLRSISNMTEDEKKITRSCGFELILYDTVLTGFANIENYIDEVSFIFMEEFLNAHHFDYRGLIPMGLALEAPEGMYVIK